MCDRIEIVKERKGETEMNSIKTTRKVAGKIIRASFPDYTGRKIAVRFADKITFYNTNWSGGSRNEYVIVASDGKTAKMNVPAPWLNVVEGARIEMPTNALVVEHSFYCGQDAGITIWAHPTHLPKWLEA